MFEILMKILPFFAILGLGYFAALRGFFSADATAHLTKFVFYFALPAMIFRFGASLSLSEVFHGASVLAYFIGTMAVYLLVTVVALLLKKGVEEAAIEAQCAAVGNVGFLAIPLLLSLLGAAAIGPVMIVLATDLIVFGSLLVIIISARRDGRVSVLTLGSVGRGLLRNPMVMAMVAGLAWAGSGMLVPAPAEEFLSILGAAATPGALFAIGASLAAKSAERLSTAIWLSTAKLGLHPLFVAIATLWIFDVPPFSAAVMVAAAAMPTAGNVYIIARHYGVAPLRVSSTILVSTVISVITLTLVIALVSGWSG